MLSRNKKIAVFFTFVSCMSSVNSQTLSDLAEAQRLKIIADIEKSKSRSVAPVELPSKTPLPPPTQDIPVIPPASKPSAPESRIIKVHSIYQKGGEWFAEVTDGRSLVVVPSNSGAVYENITLKEIDGDGVRLKISKPCKKKICVVEKTVGVGGVLK